MCVGKKTGAKEKLEHQTLRICPNCGLVLGGKEFLPNNKKLMQQIGIAFDPIADRFLCLGCNFSGLPLEVDEKDLKKIKFRNEKIDLPLQRAEPAYFKALAYALLLFVAGCFLLVLSGSDPTLGYLVPFSALLSLGGVGCGLYWFYLFFIKKKPFYEK